MECSGSRAHRVSILLPSLEGQGSASSDLSVEESQAVPGPLLLDTSSAKTHVGGSTGIFHVIYLRHVLRNSFNQRAILQKSL